MLLENQGVRMKNFDAYLKALESDEKRKKLEELFHFIEGKFPSLKGEIKWGQPMYIMDKTFILGLSVSKDHFSLAPEKLTLEKFREDILNSGYSMASQIFRIKWTDKVNYQLIEDIVAFNMEDKKAYKKFWR